MSATRHPRCRQSRLAPALVLLASGLALLAIIPLVAAQSGGGGGTAQTCYWPDGTVSGYKPCSSKGGACCYNLDVEHRDACYSNGMCGSLYFGYYYRGACTDRNWGASCPNVCKSVTNYSVPLRFCKHMDAWCCQPEASRDDCCAQGVGIQWLNATQVNYHTQPLAAVDFEYDLAGAYTTTTDAGASAAALATAATRSSSLPSTAATNGAAQNSSGSDNSGANNGTSSNGGEKCANNDGKVIAVGAGLGVPLLAALAGLVWLAAKQRKYKRIGTPSPVVMPQEMPGHYTGGGGGGNGRGYADSPQYTTAELSGSGMKPELAGHSVEVPGPDAQRHYR